MDRPSPSRLPPALIERQSTPFTRRRVLGTTRIATAAAPAPSRTDFYYVRLIQRNGQRGWSSPIWVE